MQTASLPITSYKTTGLCINQWPIYELVKLQLALNICVAQVRVKLNTFHNLYSFKLWHTTAYRWNMRRIRSIEVCSISNIYSPLQPCIYSNKWVINYIY